jgi:hypothetical protein
MFSLHHGRFLGTRTHRGHAKTMCILALIELCFSVLLPPSCRILVRGAREKGPGSGSIPMQHTVALALCLCLLWLQTARSDKVSPKGRLYFYPIYKVLMGLVAGLRSSCQMPEGTTMSMLRSTTLTGKRR